MLGGSSILNELLNKPGSFAATGPHFNCSRPRSADIELGLVRWNASEDIVAMTNALDVVSNNGDGTFVTHLSGLVMWVVV